MGKLLDIDTYETYMDQQNELIGVIAENSSTKLKSKITTPATGDIGQVLSVNSVGSDGKPKTWIASDIDDILEYSDVVSGKVDKVTGKSLSTNDYDNSAKSKVDSIPSIVATKDSEVTTSTKLHFKQTNGYTDFAEMSDLESLSDDLANKLDKPTNTVSVGKVLKVKTVNADGTFVCEWADDVSGSVDDVKVNGTSIVTDGVANIPVATQSVNGVIKANNYYNVHTDRGMIISLINDKSLYDVRSNYSFIGKGTLENIKTDLVGRALADDTATAYTSEQQTKAIARLGAEPKHNKFELIEDVTIDSDQTFKRYSKPNGDAYEFKEVFIDVTATSNFTAWKEWIITSVANSISGNCRIGRNYSVSSLPRAQIHCFNSNGLWEMEIFLIDSEGKSTTAHLNSFFVETDVTDAIRNIYLDGLKANTNIKIYARV